MVDNPPKGFQRIIPYVVYEDAPAAIDFLCRAFGFEVQDRHDTDDGRVMHCELSMHDNVVMVASAVPDMGHGTPAGLGGNHGGVAMYVDDVDAVHERAVAAGANVTRPLEDQFYGDRTFAVRDAEGHDWHLHTHIRDVPPEEIAAANQ